MLEDAGLDAFFEDRCEMPENDEPREMDEGCLTDDEEALANAQDDEEDAFFRMGSYESDSDALASAGHGMDEDYGGHDSIDNYC